MSRAISIREEEISDGSLATTTRSSASLESFADSGPAVLLPARVVMPFSIVLHEMATNAAKYGALSRRSGNVEITWQVSDGIEKSVELVWLERGGPKVKAAASTGFGIKLINHVICHDLDGDTKIDFDPAGVRLTIALSVGDFAGERKGERSAASDSATAPEHPQLIQTLTGSEAG